MKRTWFAVGVFITLLTIFSPAVALALTEDRTLLNLLLLAAAYGAIGGVVYELIALQGNIEWPHPSSTEEAPQGGFPFANTKHLFDLGIIARLIVGAISAVAIYWVIPLDQGLKFAAVSVVAGSAGTAIFRSLQDRLLSVLNAAKVDTMGRGLKAVNVTVEGLQTRAAQLPADMQEKIAEIRGSVQALIRIAGNP